MRAVTNDSRAVRRGVTLMEMLVTVALLVLIMSILVAIFRSATEAITIHQVTSVLDQDLRRIDTMIRQDLDGITATLTPPLNPKDYRGYFSYGENEISDSQGEDTDDWLAFTAKAPAGLPFVGYVTVPVTGQDDFTGSGNTPRTYQRVAIKSDYAEVVYFLRNHTLYRRIFLILPQSNPIYVGSNNNAGNPANPNPLLPGAGRGDMLGSGGFFLNPLTGLITASTTPNTGWQYLNDVSARPASATGTGTPTPNSLSDLTNPHNRALRRRFCDDYVTATTGAAPPDGNTDDVNGDGIPDFYPTMYATIFGALTDNPTHYLINVPNPAQPPLSQSFGGNYDVLAFPYEFPSAFPNPNPPVNMLGPMHIARADSTGTFVINHAPLQIGDPLGYPTTSNGLLQTYWAFPTKKEMRSSSWDDPVHRLNVADPLDNALLSQAPGLSLGANQTFLPPMSGAYRLNPEPFVEPTPAGSDLFALSMGDPAGLGVNKPLWKSLIDDDAIATNVRSFDIKVLDPNTLLYQDLGHGDANGDINNPNEAGINNLPSTQFYANYLLQGFAHEGRMPPLTGDRRLDFQFPTLSTLNGLLNNNIGDDNAWVRRLRRVYDTWSTDYSNPPWQTLNPIYWPGYPSPNDASGNTPNYPPIPGYPPPYPATLRAMQIQVRFVDPRNERLKVLTIRHDFTDNL